MNRDTENRFYWTEGVTRHEVESALSTTKYPALYRRPVRRMLVTLYVLLLVLLCCSTLFDGVKAQSYTEALAGIALLILYFVMRKSVRLIADAPAELLDERLIAIRDRTYVMAYRWLAFVAGGLIGMSIARDTAAVWEGSFFSLILFVAMVVVGLPSMVLAWSLPSEE